MNDTLILDGDLIIDVDIDGEPDSVISVGHETIVRPITITENGHYEPEAGVDGFSSVDVDVKYQNLIDYINEVTGGSDTNLSDAIATLADGYGGSGYTLEDIAEGALRNITEVTIKSVTIKSNTFLGSAFKIIHLPNAITLSGRPFSSNSNLELIDIPNVENLGDAFYGCSRLSGSYGEEVGILRLPKVVTANIYAFYNSKVQKVYFMATASYLQNNIFYNCSNLTDIYVPWSEGEVANAPWSNNSNVVVHYNTVYDENGEPIL